MGGPLFSTKSGSGPHSSRLWRRHFLGISLGHTSSRYRSVGFLLTYLCLSLRATGGSAAISPLERRLLRRFAPRNDGVELSSCLKRTEREGFLLTRRAFASLERSSFAARRIHKPNHWLASVGFESFLKRTEREGFEPSVPVYPIQRFSKPSVSAAHPPLQKRKAPLMKYSFFL